MVSTSARNPNESYADRAKKASTSSTARPPQHAAPNAPSSLKPPQVNVWAERIREQQAHAAPQPAQTPRQRAGSEPQPPRDESIQPRSPPPDLSAQLSILDHKDDHDPFVVRVPPHLSRRSSSSTNPLPTSDPATWPVLAGTAPHSNPSSTGYDSPLLSAPPSRENSTASVRPHALSGSQVRVAPSQHSRSASQSRVQSRSGSSASSPRLQIRGRTLPVDDSLLPDLRLDTQQRRSSTKRASPALPDPPNHISPSFQIDPPTDPAYYRHPPVPPLQDMPPRYTHNFVPPYALPPHFAPAHVPGQVSPPYISPHSGQGTPPYPPYPPFPAYMYGHPPLFWGDIPSHSHNHFHNQPPVHANASDHTVHHQIEFGSTSPVITTESGTSKPPSQFQNSSQPRPLKSVVFGTINPADSQDDATLPPSGEERHPDAMVEHITEQFTAFSIGVAPDEPGPSRFASRKSSVRSLSKMSSTAQLTANDGAKDANSMSPPSREINGTKKPVKWEFGTTLSEDLDDSPHSSPPAPLSNHQSELVDGPPATLNPLPSQGPLQADRSLDRSETASASSDVWVVKDYGYGFGDHSGSGNAPEVARSEQRERERERERTRESFRDRDMYRDQYRDRGWIPARHGWRHENGAEETREAWEQQMHVDGPRHMRARRGSFSGHGHDRGGFPTRRGRGYGSRFYGGRGRGFHHHQRTGSYPYVPPPPQPPPPLPPFEVLPPPIDALNGYSPYAPPETEPFEVIPPPPQPRVPLTPAYSMDAMQNLLLTQLEYYLSTQNLAQDFYLRQRMDSEGWIPIQLLASFKRVQQLQTDIDIVKEVLARSTVVEINGDWVRMGARQWELFVLPNAPRSLVTGADPGAGEIPGAGPELNGDLYAEHGEIEGENGEIEGDCDGDDCEGDDEEDDIEFVIGEEAEGSWMVPERKQ